MVFSYAKGSNNLQEQYQERQSQGFLIVNKSFIFAA